MSSSALLDAAAAAELGSTISVADEAPRPSSVGMLKDELVGVVVLGGIGLMSCWRGLDEGCAWRSGWLVEWWLSW